MEPEMQSPSGGTLEPAEFRDHVAYLRTWATVASSRAYDLSYEWPAVAFALAALYVLLVVRSAQMLDFLDIAVLIGILGTGFSLRRFEYNSSVALTELAKSLAGDEGFSSSSK